MSNSVERNRTQSSHPPESNRPDPDGAAVTSGTRTVKPSAPGAGTQGTGSSDYGKLCAEGIRLTGRCIRQAAVGMGWFCKAAGEILVTNMAGGALVFLFGAYANNLLGYTGVATGSAAEGGAHALLTHTIPDVMQQGCRRFLNWLTGKQSNQADAQTARIHELDDCTRMLQTQLDELRQQSRASTLANKRNGGSKTPPPGAAPQGRQEGAANDDTEPFPSPPTTRRRASPRKQ
ncbi:MAG: hypothetical protein OXC07_12010 [Kistimonas sp.]|nr:hypothetical protein [Kistimonas sp.]